tara:strand:+ start:301 stop:789 length:489 start_codon:yes stop_codon:yes gene_type:complete
MKKILLLLLFIPLMSVGQITYNDLMSINSVDTFKRVVIENGFEFDSSNDDTIWYGWNIVKDSINGNKSSKWAKYTPSTGAFIFTISRTDILSSWAKTNPDNSNNEYDLIVEEIKSKCKYFEIKKNDGNDFVTYSCSESSYKGKLGFMVAEGSGFIRHFPPQD